MRGRLFVCDDICERFLSKLIVLTHKKVNAITRLTFHFVRLFMRNVFLRHLLRLLDQAFVLEFIGLFSGKKKKAKTRTISNILPNLQRKKKTLFQSLKMFTKSLNFEAPRQSCEGAVRNAPQGATSKTEMRIAQNNLVECDDAILDNPVQRVEISSKHKIRTCVGLSDPNRCRTWNVQKSIYSRSCVSI